MSKTVLLLGRKGISVDDVRQKLSVQDVTLLGSTSPDDGRDALNRGPVDMVIMGAGIGLDARLEIVKHEFAASNSTTVHMKDFDSGPAVMLPLVDGVLKGLMTRMQPPNKAMYCGPRPPVLI